MSQPSHLPTTTTATKDPRLFSAKAQALDCFVFLLFITILVVLIGLVPAVTRVLIFLQPGTPEFKIDSSSLAIRNVSYNTITADWDVTLSVKNPNTKGMSYDKIEASTLINDKERLSNITIKSFKQSGKEQTSIQAAFDRISVQVNCSTTKNNTVDLPCGGDVNLSMELQARAKYGGWTWPVEKDLIKVVCDDVKIEFDSNTSKVGIGSSNCDVNGHWKSIVTKCTALFWKYVYVAGIILCIICLSL